MFTWHPLDGDGQTLPQVPGSVSATEGGFCLVGEVRVICLLNDFESSGFLFSFTVSESFLCFQAGSPTPNILLMPLRFPGSANLVCGAHPLAEQAAYQGLWSPMAAELWGIQVGSVCVGQKPLGS